MPPKKKSTPKSKAKPKKTTKPASSKKSGKVEVKVEKTKSFDAAISRASTSTKQAGRDIKKVAKETSNVIKEKAAPHKYKIGKAGRVFGYLIAITINIAIAYIAIKILGWNIPFLTDNFDFVLPYFLIAIAISIAINFLYLFYDKKWFKSLGDIVTGAFSLVVLWAFYHFFPFDFSSFRELNVELIVRILIVLVMVGVGISIIVNLVKLVTYRSKENDK